MAVPSQGCMHDRPGGEKVFSIPQKRAAIPHAARGQTVCGVQPMAAAVAAGMGSVMLAGAVGMAEETRARSQNDA